MFWVPSLEKKDIFVTCWMLNNFQFGQRIFEIGHERNSLVRKFIPTTTKVEETSFFNFSWRKFFLKILRNFGETNISWTVVIYSSGLRVVKSGAFTKEEKDEAIICFDISRRSKLCVSIIVI